MGFAAHLFFAPSEVDQLEEELKSQIEERLLAAEPELEPLLVERASATVLRVVIDHPAGVDLGLCERVTHELRDLVGDVGLEVSSPGPRRPLTKPAHFRRFVGRRARVRTREARGGHRSFTGELVDADEQAVTVAAGGGVVSIPYSEIQRSNLLESGDV